MPHSSPSRSRIAIALGFASLLVVAVAAGVGVLGVAIALSFVAPIVATRAELSRRRMRGNESLVMLDTLPITARQRRYFTVWLLYGGFIVVCGVLIYLGGSIGDLLR